MAVHGVLAENERRGDLAVREPRGHQTQHLRLAAAQWRVAVRFGANDVVEEPGERPLQLALVVRPRQVGVAAQRDEAGVRQKRGKLASAADRERCGLRVDAAPASASSPLTGTGGHRTSGRDRETPRRLPPRPSGADSGSRPRSRPRCREGGRAPPASGQPVASSCGRSRRASGESLRGCRRARHSRRRTRSFARAPGTRLHMPSSPDLHRNRRRSSPARRRKRHAPQPGSRARTRASAGRRGSDPRAPRRSGRNERRGAGGQALRRTRAHVGSPTPPRGGSPNVPRTGAVAPHRPSRMRSAAPRARRSGCPAPWPVSLMAGTGHVNKMARQGEAAGWPVTRDHGYVQTRHIDGLTIRLLRNGDTRTVSALFERLGPRSRERRFCGAKPRLSTHDLRVLARVDAEHHVLVGYLGGDPEPVGIARLVREGRPAEVAFAVADELPGSRYRHDPDARARGRCAGGRDHGAARHGVRRQRSGGIAPLPRRRVPAGALAGGERELVARLGG